MRLQFIGSGDAFGSGGKVEHLFPCSWPERNSSNRLRSVFAHRHETAAN